MGEGVRAACALPLAISHQPVLRTLIRRRAFVSRDKDDFKKTLCGDMTR